MSSCSELCVVCVFSLEFTRQAERIVRRCSRRTLEHPQCGAPTAAVPHSAFDGMLRLERRAVGCSSRAVAVTALPSQAV